MISEELIAIIVGGLVALVGALGFFLKGKRTRLAEHPAASTNEHTEVEEVENLERATEKEESALTAVEALEPSDERTAELAKLGNKRRGRR